MLRSRTAVALAACLLAAACSQGAELAATGSSEPGAATAPPASSPPPAASPESSPPFEADTTTKEQPPVGEPLTVTDIRVAGHEGYDRVVFELAGPPEARPGWRIGYVEDPRRDGSGEPVDLAGDATLSVRIEGVGYPFDTGREGTTSAPPLPPGLEVVEEVEFSTLFEGVYETFAGVSGALPFRVLYLTDPRRVVVDVRHE